MPTPSNPSGDPAHDPFAPPKTPCEVQCVHCGESYESWQIEWRDEPTASGAGGGFWCCPTPGCDGVGFGFDIFPVDPAWTDENGEHLISQFADDDDDEDDDDEDPIAGLDFDDDDEDEDSTIVGPMAVDTFGVDVFVIDLDRLGVDLDKLAQPPLGNSPQPPFNHAPPGKSSVMGEDDLPF